MKKIIFIILTVLFLLLPVACTHKKEQTPQEILNKFKQLHQTLATHDMTYAETINTNCKQGEQVPVMGAEVLFSSFEQWKSVRNDLFTTYSDLNFDLSNTRIRDFKNQQLIDILVTLSARMNEINTTIEPTFINNTQCTETTLPSKVEPTNPHLKSINCIFECQDLLTLSENIKKLSILQAEAINKAEKNIENIQY